MTDTPVMQRVCTLCGAGPDDDLADGICAACVRAIGSVVIVPADTMVAAGGSTLTARRPANFGDYEIISELAQGGMGVVYVARQISLNRQVALKMILTPCARDEQIRRFQAEAEHAATLEHPNIVPIYDSGSTDGLPYYSMKLIRGRSLNAELRRLVLEPRKGVALMATIARAVHYAHERGILHRDLKPANILIDDQGIPYVGDFGISKRVGSSDGMTREGAVIGTPFYMSPEQAGGVCAALTTAADVYGLGAIFYEMLTLRAPFSDAGDVDVLRKVRTEDPAAPRKLRRGVDRDLETICLKCLEKSPARRYPSAEAFACDLDRWLNGEPITARPHSVVERGLKWARRYPAIAGSVALGVALAIAAAAFHGHSMELVQRAENSKFEERRRLASQAIKDGDDALQKARDSAADHSGRVIEDALILAEDRYRTALVHLPSSATGIKGLRESALLNFEASLHAKNYRQAREKLLLARSVKLGEAEFDSKWAQLTKQESERGEQIRARVKMLMDDAASLVRKVTHENAVYELISLKDPTTLEELADYIGHERPECRRLALDVLAWVGDASVVKTMLPYIEKQTPSGENNPPAVQEAALNAICKLAADDDLETYAAVQRRIVEEPGEKSSLLFHNIKLRHAEFARRQAQREASPNESVAQLSERARRLKDSNAFREALELYDRLVVAQPESVTFINERGLLRVELNDPKGALQDFDSVISRIPKQKDGYVNRSLAKRGLGDEAGALGDLDKALEFDPNDAALLSTRGNVRMTIGDVKGAMADFDKALKINKDELFALANRGGARARLKDFAGALSDYDRALALSPMFREALTGRGCTRMELHDDEGALSDFDKTLALDPTQKHCYYNRAALRMRQKNWKEAIRDFDHFIALDPKVSVAHFNRGVAKARLGDSDAAASDYQKAIEFDPKRVDAMINLGNIRAEKGETDAAMKLFDRALEINPKKIEGWSARAELHFVLGQYEKAVSDSKNTLKLLPENVDPERLKHFEGKVKQYEAKLP